jgi:ABC-2 type transport system permease protein
MRGFRAGLLAQFTTLARSPNCLLTLATMPISTVMLLAVMRHSGRGDLIGHALVAPVLMAQWALALLVAGELVENERWLGTLELIVASPTSFAVLLAGRVAAVSAIGSVAFLEVWAVAALGFRLPVVVGHPGLFLLASVVTTLAVAGWATVLAAALVLTRAAHVLRNSLTFPVYLAGGVLVPVSFLPSPVPGLSRAVFLSWCAELLRDSYGPLPVTGSPARLAVILGFAVAGFALGNSLVRRSISSLRRSGRLSLA